MILNELITIPILLTIDELRLASYVELPGLIIFIKKLLPYTWHSDKVID